MSPTVTLTIVHGFPPDKQYTFKERSVCIIGRAADCHLQLPSDPLHLDVSRHHCVLVLDPPHVCVRDCGSRNGTYVNGRRINQRPVAPESQTAGADECDLKDGDELRLGHTVFRVGISEAAACAECGCEMPAEPRQTEPENYVCDWCSSVGEGADHPQGPCPV